MKQDAQLTAVEWIAEKVRHSPLMSSSDYNKLLEQAKEMEKEQRIKDIDFGHGIPSWANINYEAYFKLSNKHELNKSE